MAGEEERISERLLYAGNTAAEKGLNLAGLCVSHYETAGLLHTDSIALTGVPLSVTRRLLMDADNPDIVAHWQGEDVDDWDALLAPQTYTTQSQADATGVTLSTLDAAEHRQRMAYDVAGLFAGSWLTLKGGKEQAIVISLEYSAAGQKLRETHGNGVVTTYTYEARTQRLCGITAVREKDGKVLQDLRYAFDPVGNVVSVRNDAHEARFWHNQKVVPESSYRYDSLYQLVRAEGREMANAAQQGPQLPPVKVPIPIDNSAYTNYTRTYRYDNAGNLTQIRHSPATGTGYTTDVTISDRSNRGVLSSLTDDPGEVDALFLAGGQQALLQPGQPLAWTPRLELLQVSGVTRAKAEDDRESYRYDSSNQRVLKTGIWEASGSTHTKHTLYLPGLELQTKTVGGTQTERLQVIVMGEAGRAQVRVLHWELGKPGELENDQIRYSLDDLVGSSCLELEGEGVILSQEEYYPYGGTSALAARTEVEAGYKSVRYSGKERDATGLYCYGYRYYQSWGARWLSADPAETADGMNLYRMVKNNPLTYRDTDGRAGVPNASQPQSMGIPPPPPPMARLGGPPPPPPPMARTGLNPPPPPPMQGQQSNARKKWTIKEDPAIYKQQGGEYPYYSSFGIALQKMNIAHYDSIDDMEAFVKVWREVGRSMTPPADKIDIDRALEVQGGLRKIDAEWSGYKKSNARETFRGDSVAVLGSYPWLSEFVNAMKGKAQSASKKMALEIRSSLIMSTSKESDSGYVKNKMIMWHFELEDGHEGVSEGLYSSEAEVTFPMYNRMIVTSIDYIPEGSSYMGDGKKFGTAHRFVVHAKIRSRAKQ